VEPLPAAFTDVRAGVLHSCGLVGDGAAYCWGFNESGQLGDGSRRDRTIPTPVLGTLRFSSLSPGGSHTCGVTPAGVYCWGLNLSGQLGDGGNADRATPGQIGSNVALVSVTAGASYNCGLTSAGAAHCWGYNEYGQLGDGSTVDQLLPTPVTGAQAFTAVGAYSFHTCGVTGGGVVYCWGRNEFGQLGNGTTAASMTPVQISGGLVFRAVDVGFWHTCGLVTDGTAYCWGRNNFGQLGIGTLDSTQVTQPLQVAGGRTFASIDVGAAFTCAIEQATNAAFCWGYNGSGQLGASVQGECQDEAGFIVQCALEPSPVSGGIAFQSISASTQHVCGLSTTSVAYCWGLGMNGQLGDGTKGDQRFSLEPVRVAGQP
jgi:alpha-tubulin suppressor-like RCC1 family protein